MRTIRGVRSLLVLTVSMALLAACGTTAPSSTTPSTAAPTTTAPAQKPAPEPVRIGLLLSATGGLAVGAQDMVRGAQLATAEINAAGGIKALGGAQFKLIQVDDESKADVVRREAERLITQEKVSAIVGPYGSGLAAAIVGVAEEKKVPVFGGLTDDNLLNKKYKYLFNLQPLGSTVVEFEMRFLKDLEKSGVSVKRIAVMVEDGAYGTNIANFVRQLAPKYGLEVAVELKYPTGNPNFAPQLSRVKAANVAAIVVGHYAEDTVNLLRAMQVEGIKLPVIGPTGSIIQAPVAALGATANGVMAVSPWSADLPMPGVKTVIENYKKMFSKDIGTNALDMYAYMYLIKEAIERAGSSDPVKLAETMHKIKLTSGPAVDASSWKVLGFDERGQHSDPNMIGIQLQDGKWVTVWPDALKSGGFKSEYYKK